jgi:cell division GTPase FtsZ
MLQVGVIGIGNTGNQIATLAMNELKIPVLAINSSEKDLETVPDSVPKKLISSTKGLSQGAGKNRSLAKSYLKESIMKVLSSDETNKFLNDMDIIFIVSSTGGGTGSGTAPLLANIIKSAYADTKVILIGVLPVNNEALSAHVNTLEYLNELYSVLENQTYMLYDNDRYAKLPSYLMMEKVNREIVEDINVIRCTYNLTTRFDSIDEQDMMRLVSFPGRIVVSRLEKIQEKDIDGKSIEDMLIDNLKTNAHAELQRDRKVIASGIITNLSQTLTESFDNHIPKVREFVGDPIHDFNHIYINEDRKLPNNVFLILSGLAKVNDKINRITDRINEIEDSQKVDDDDDALSDVDVNALSSMVSSNDLSKTKTDTVDIKGIFDKFM